MDLSNPIGLCGIEFVEFVSPQPERLDALFQALGFSKTHSHRERSIDLYTQGDIHFLLNRQPNTFAHSFSNTHGPSICSMGWRVQDAPRALGRASARGAKPCPLGDFSSDGRPVPAVYGIGNSLLYFVEPQRHLYETLGFVPLEKPALVAPKGFIAIDHLTNNVAKGELRRWADFYQDIFGFTEVRYFDIRGEKTGLQSFALRSPCGQFCIPINEGTESASQINEYLREYKGPGIQHLAFLTDDILETLHRLDGSGIETLDIDKTYYQSIFERLPQVEEDRSELERLNVLIDGDEEGYLLQIFTRNLIGPIFIEIIQRKNHLSFGEGNFGALFRSIERDQKRRGVL
ncbi:MAG: 4-hydroxyphenylpyruvate dioxygenase [Bdellovibrionaceae bacterium]|nr:4-hydroxyphenylpyruvate dioxygenase [Bdellovibrionales bacterium]MCB9255267.1 4-hydroxyphenylpyruvate dioxygenase [Pseudobdellovibrionaceae bacterium]